MKRKEKAKTGGCPDCKRYAAQLETAQRKITELQAQADTANFWCAMTKTLKAVIEDYRSGLVRTWRA